MKIVAFAASNSSTSINKKIVTHASEVFQTEIDLQAEIEILDLNDFEMPIYSSDRETATGIPALAQEFYDKIGAADAVIISYAEHNGGYTAAYKNIFDWTSRIGGKVFQGKPVVVTSASPGPGGASSVLNAAVTSAPFFGADIVASFSIPSFHDAFDIETGKLSNPELAQTLRDALNGLAAKGLANKAA